MYACELLYYYKIKARHFTYDGLKTTKVNYKISLRFPNRLTARFGL